MGVQGYEMMGGDSNGVPFKDWAYQEWESKYGVKPPWGKKEFVTLATARGRFDSEQLARSAWTTYLSVNEPFFEGHSPAKFLFDLSRWTAKAPKPRTSVVRKAESFPGADKAQRMREILAEVYRDPTIPEPMKRTEASRRWKELT